LFSGAKPDGAAARRLKLISLVDPEAGCRVEAGLLEVCARLSCGTQFFVGNIAPSIERCGRVEATRQIAPGNGPVGGHTGKQES
jgi:hypothetical protein